MPVHGAFISAGAGSSIPITGGAATVGDVGVDTRFGPVNVGGLFGSPAGDTATRNLFIPAVLFGVALVTAAFIFRRR